ncbi:MAG: hypothetical protein QNJ88_05470 [Acidimicrobiia bacterium]|nr:hypothetical protein [Acidimicrobiia bacterium]
MTTRERAYGRLVAINPAVDLDEYAPTTDEAAAFLRSIEEASMDTNTRELLEPTGRSGRRPRWLAGAVAFAAVIILVGAVALWPTTDDVDPTVPPGTEGPTPTSERLKPTTPPPGDPLAVGQELVAAYNSGDWHRYRAIFTTEASVLHDAATSFMGSSGGLVEWNRLEKVYRWAVATGSRYELASCVGNAVEVACDIDWSHPLVGPRRISVTATVLDGKIVDYAEEVTGSDFIGAIGGFHTWVELNTADQQLIMFNGAEPMFEPESAALWNLWLPEFNGSASGLDLEQLNAISELIDAFNTGRIDDYMETFLTGIVVTFPDKGGPDVPLASGSGADFSADFLRWRQQKLWEIWLGGWMSMSDCRARGDAAACSITYTDEYVSRSIGRIDGTVELTINNSGRITSYHQDWGTGGEQYDQVVLEFFEWLDQERPDSVELMALNGGLDPVRSAESAKLWNELSAEFLARAAG